MLRVLKTQRMPKAQPMPKIQRGWKSIAAASLLALVATSATGAPANDPDLAVSATESTTQPSDIPFVEPDATIAPQRNDDEAVPTLLWQIPELSNGSFVPAAQGIVGLPDSSVLMFAATGGRGMRVGPQGAHTLTGPGVQSLALATVFSVVTSAQFEQDSTLYAYVSFGAEQSVVSMTLTGTELSEPVTVFGPIPASTQAQSDTDTPDQVEPETSTRIEAQSHGALAVSQQGNIFVGVPDVVETHAVDPSGDAEPNDDAEPGATDESAETQDNAQTPDSAQTPESAQTTDSTNSAQAESTEPTTNQPRDSITTLTTPHPDSQAQHLATSYGKILRLDSSGSAPASNPLTNSPLWTAGHATPIAMAWLSSGSLIELERSATGYELNAVIGGRNYGWPDAVGAVSDPAHQYGYTNPAYVWGQPEVDLDLETQPHTLVAINDDAYVSFTNAQHIEKLTFNGTSMSVQRLSIQGFSQVHGLTTLGTQLVVVGPNGVAIM